MAAVVVAPWAILPIIAAWLLLVGFGAVLEVLIGDRYFVDTTMRYLALVALYTQFGLVIAYAVVLVYGVPLHMCLALRGYAKPQGYILAGVAGAVSIALVTGSGLTFAFVLAASGAAVSGLFWAISRK